MKKFQRIHDHLIPESFVSKGYCYPGFALFYYFYRVLKLLVIRTPKLQALHEFYTHLGFHFDYHQHGSSLPYHYSATIGAMVFEIYPLAKGQAEADLHLRLGFEIERFDDVITALKQENVPFISEPMQTDFGFMAVVQDPDGRKLELYKK